MKGRQSHPPLPMVVALAVEGSDGRARKRRSPPSSPSPSLSFGTADFAGGLASRRIPALRVAFVGQLLGLPVMVAGLLLVDGTLSSRALWWGAAAGLAGGLGILAFYRAMADGPMSVVAPVTALLTAVVPVVAGVGLGERPDAVAWAGVALALVAIALVTRDPSRAAAHASGPVGPTIGRALLAGTLFGLAFVAFSRPGDVAGLWPLLGSRLASLPVFGLLVVVTRTGVAVPDEARRPTAASGVLDMLANVFVLEAFTRGLLTLVSVVTALYPATTLLLARFVLDERIRRDQVAGLALAAVAVIMISL
ncbi:MAG: EamA family transporter [Actinomycetota bacterium]